MEGVLKLNKDCFGKIVESRISKDFPTIESQEKFQAIIVHGDSFFPKDDYEENGYFDLPELLSKVNSSRLIEARFFNEKEEYRILRTFINGEVSFVFRHIVDNETSDDCDYANSVDTSADFYKNGCVLKIRNYIKKRGLVNSYDDLRFVKLINK